MADTPPVLAPHPQTLVLSDGYEDLTMVTLAGTSPFAIYTAATAAQRRISKVTKLVITNPTAGPLNVTVLIYKAATTVSYEWYPLQAIASKARIEFTDPGILLYASDELRVTESGAGLSVFVTTREYQGNRT